MILPIVAYGNPILRKVADPVDASYPELRELLLNMWETLYHSNGVGLAAPQINHSIRLFIVDSLQLAKADEQDDDKEFSNDHPIKAAFINPEIISLGGEDWKYNEGCLSIPKIREDIYRAATVTLKYQDENFAWHTGEFDGITARIILHEYDHIEGKLFIDHLKPLKKRLLKSKLDDIVKGRIKVDYRMIFAR